MRVRDRIPVVVALVLAGLGVALLWVPWVPLDRHYDCGWTCYVPLSDRHIQTIVVSGRGGLAVAPVGSVLVLVAALAGLVVSVSAPRALRSMAAFALVSGVVGLVATGLELARVLRQQFITLPPHPSRNGDVAAAALGLGAVLAIVVALAVCALAAARLRGVLPRDRPRVSGLRAAGEQTSA